jgi:tRNA1(Val) A37 N6-methylase TrmN6
LDSIKDKESYVQICNNIVALFHKYGYIKERNVQALESLSKQFLGFSSVLKIIKENICSNNNQSVINHDFQKTLTKDMRKSLSINFTKKHVITHLYHFIKMEAQSILDPFAGDGRLITAYLLTLPDENSLPYVTLIEIVPEASVYALYELLEIYLKRGDTLEKIKIFVGNTFSMVENIGKHDLILMNPPFIRVHRIDSHIMGENFFNQYPELKLLKGQPGLHVFGLWLALHHLKPHGKLLAVLPNSTFYTDYSVQFKQMLLSKFQIKQLISFPNELSLSDESTFSESAIIFKMNSIENNASTKFTSLFLDAASNDIIDQIEIEVDLTKPLIFEDWTKYLLHPRLVELSQLLINQNLFSASDLSLKIIRGIEMYGPNFYFFPNNKFNIKFSDSSFNIYSKSESYELAEMYFERIFRRPGLYNKLISPNVKDFVLRMPPDEQISEDLIAYINKNEIEAEVAKRKFDKNWLHHTYNQLVHKKPYGYLFLVDKLGLITSSTVSHYSSTRLPCTKNFYVFSELNNLDSKIYASWLNSSLFLLCYILFRRELGSSYGRLQISDYMKHPLFPKISNLDKHILNQTLEIFDSIKMNPLPPYPERFSHKLIMQLDTHWLRLLNIPDPDKILSEIYSEVSSYLKHLQNVQK